MNTLAVGTDGAFPGSPSPLLDLQNLTKRYRLGRDLRKSRQRSVLAVDDVTLTISAGQSLAVVGESGSGKSTLGRMVLRQVRPSAGRVIFAGDDIFETGDRARRRAMRRDIQAVFQDPLAALDPRRTAGDSVAEPLNAFGVGDRASRRARVAQLFEQVGLNPSTVAARPLELSGGQRQRVVIARAIALEPRLVVADEPVSSLDVSVQAQIIGLLADLGQQAGISYLFISHDLAVVRYVAQQVAVLYRGRLVELGPTTEVLTSPHHPYTEELCSASRAVANERAGSDGPRPAPRGRRASAPGGPGPAPSGCPFRQRCPKAAARCAVEVPELLPRSAGRSVACHFGAK
jgi:oligopeptide/dipeptide ABC transporter ATP-binding protein